MPHFCDACHAGAAADVWVCQKCGGSYCSNSKCRDYRRAIWVTELTTYQLPDGTVRHQGGNVCVECLTGGTQRSY